MPNLVKSISYSQDEILKWIIRLHCPDGFDLDPTYSKGLFYKNIPQPRLKFDISPQIEGVHQANCINLPLDNESVNNIIFDPPFLVSWGKTHDYPCEKRFGYFPSRKSLREMYKKSIQEFYRILKPGGKLLILDYLLMPFRANITI